MYFAKLSCATRLFLVTVFCPCTLGDCLTIRDLRFFKLHRNLLIILQAPLQGSQVEFALTMDNGLTKLLALLYDPCGVLLAHFQHSGHQLLCIRRVNSLDCP